MPALKERLHAGRESWHRLSRRGRIIFTASVLIVLGLGWWLLSQDDKERQKRPQAPVALATATRKDVPVTIDGLGTVQAFNTVTVHSQVDGQLIEIAFKEGQDVKAGDVLAKIDPRTFKAQLDQAIANQAKDAALLENARRDLARYAKLGDSISGQVVDTQKATVRQLEATVKADQAAVDNAKIQLGYTTVVSPINGRTGIRQVDVGNIVHPGDANGLVVIAQLEPISVVFSLPQQNLQMITTQMEKNPLPVTALDASQTAIDEGTLTLVDNQIDQTTGTVKLKAEFPNEKHLLWPGGFTSVRMLLDTKKDALVVPTVAIQRGPQGAYVFVYRTEEKTVEQRSVKTDMISGQDTVIAEGLKDGEQIVTDGMAKLQDGSKVTLAGEEKPEAKKETREDGDKLKGERPHRQREQPKE